jgi:type III secretory pathway lipoprotein EscJ
MKQLISLMLITLLTGCEQNISSSSTGGSSDQEQVPVQLPVQIDAEEEAEDEAE